jgi:hypothetical protein
MDLGEQAPGQEVEGRRWEVRTRPGNMKAGGLPFCDVCVGLRTAVVATGALQGGALLTAVSFSG